MRSVRTIHVVSAHAEGEVGDVVVGGVEFPPGKTIEDQRRFLVQDGKLWQFLLNEPRGGVFRHANLLVPPKNPEASHGFIIMEPEDAPPMSGSNAICVATVLLDTGVVRMEEPETSFTLEAPGGLVRIRATCRNGKAERISVLNLPSFAVELDVNLDVQGIGKLRVDTAFGGDSFVVVDAKSLGFELERHEARRLATTGMKIAAAANSKLQFEHPEFPDLKRFSFCLFAGALKETDKGLKTRSAVAIHPGKIDRSPTGTAVSARMALLHERGDMAVGDRLTAKSIIGSQFSGRITGTTRVGKHGAILPEISGRAWVTGTHQLLVDPDDPWPTGYRLPDTWGCAQEPDP